MLSDEELKKDFKIFVDENDIINLISSGIKRGIEDIIRSTEIVGEILLKIFKDNPQKKYKMLIDLSLMGKNRTGFSSKARKIAVQIAFSKQLEKFAIISPSMFFKVVINFIVSASRRRKHMGWFSSREEALKWLKEE